MEQELQQLITFLKKNRFKAVCSNCNEAFELSKVPLFDATQFTPEAAQLLAEKKAALKELKQELRATTAKTKQKVGTTTRSVNMGFMLERLAPVLEAFPFDRNDCRSLFDPIDYVIFEGLNKTGKVQKIFFVDIKSGEARLKKNQKAIKQLVENKQVHFETY